MLKMKRVLKNETVGIPVDVANFHTSTMPEDGYVIHIDEIRTVLVTDSQLEVAKNKKDMGVDIFTPVVWMD